MEFPTMNGLIGAAGGLVLGAIDYTIVGRMLESIPRRNASAPGLTPERRSTIMKMIAAMSFLGLPVAGYFVGEAVLP
jgi:hypothetical protein